MFHHKAKGPGNEVTLAPAAIFCSFIVYYLTQLIYSYPYICVEKNTSNTSNI